MAICTHPKDKEKNIKSRGDGSNSKWGGGGGGGGGGGVPCTTHQTHMKTISFFFTKHINY